MNHPSISRIKQSDVLNLPEAPVVYWISPSILSILSSPKKLGRGEGKLAVVKNGLDTGDNERFVRFLWEIVENQQWKCYAKGGGYGKWDGFNYYLLRWGNAGEYLKSASKYS